MAVGALRCTGSNICADNAFKAVHTCTLLGRSLKLLHIELDQVIPVDLLSHTDVVVLDYNEDHGPEQCKGPDQDL